MYLPAAQRLQEVAAAVLLYEPGPQGLQTVAAPVLYVPVMQGAGLKDPTFMENPGGEGSQVWPSALV